LANSSEPGCAEVSQTLAPCPSPPRHGKHE
jgi:hypothetical protein